MVATRDSYSEEVLGMTGSVTESAIDDGPSGLPADLAQRLRGFRARVWRIKLLEAIGGAAAGVLVGYLAVLGLDRVMETPWGVRLGVFGFAVTGCAAVPVALHRWIWSHRRFEQLARLIARSFPALGDQLLGIIELARETASGSTTASSRTGLGGSRRLAEAAIAQVAARTRSFDFRDAVPRPRHLAWLSAAAVPLVIAIAAAWLAPEASANAWARFLAPWQAIERFTYTRVEKIPETIVVPRGEPATVPVTLAGETRWRPEDGFARVGRQPKVVTPLVDGRYSFDLPPQLVTAPIDIAVGDARGRATIEPMPRPEIVGLAAEIKLPAYLARSGVIRQEIRGGTLAPVAGSTVTLRATADRKLATASVDGAALAPDGDTVTIPPRTVVDESTVSLTWQDIHGLDGARPLVLSIQPRADEPPAVVALDIPASRDMLLNTDTLRFRVAARDDFGIRRVGIEWEGVDDWSVATDPALKCQGERLITLGGPDLDSLEAAATFCPDALGIAPQPILLRAFAEDYKPGRKRAYSSPMLIYVVDRAEHALVLNARLQQFRQQASEVRDREMALLAANKELRDMPAEQLTDPENRGKLMNQAAAEEANARRLDRLVDAGAALVREATKNPDFEAGTLEQLAEDIQTLADIAENRMPGVADLLQKAAEAKFAKGGSQPSEGKSGAPSGQQGSEASAQGKEGGEPGDPSQQTAGKQGESGGEPKESQPGGGGGQQQDPSGETPPQVGEDRSKQGGGQGGESSPEGEEPAPPVPQVVDKESSQQPAGESQSQKSPPGGPGRLGLPTTQAGVAPPSEEQPPGEPPSAEEALDEAIAKQEELLEQFAKVADELAAVMARLEGSTFVKRLKLASREQATIGDRLAGLAADAFVVQSGRPAGVVDALGDVKQQNARETDKVSAIMDDLQAYFDRRQLPAFRTVLDEMKELDVLGSMRQVSDSLTREAGMSIAQAEFWSDTFDRLADDLVPPPEGSGSGQGEGEQRESVPPEVVLEIMKVLEEETNLREETRVTEQTKLAMTDDDLAAMLAQLSGRQESLADRVVDLVDRLLDEPDGERQFGPEIELFEQVEGVMIEAADLLAGGDTGPKAIAAETEVIELLLQAQAAANGGGGGGGGGSGGTPGGGATGSASTSALALVGAGNRSKAEAGGEKEQATGVSGRVLPEEFRAGLDAYFNQLERERR
jgi:hypothetical protein